MDRRTFLKDENRDMLLLHRIQNDTRHPASAASRCPELLASWLRHAPGSKPDPEADFEDWAEPAHILMAMERHGPVTIVPSHVGIHMDGDCTPLVKSNPGAPEAVMWGRFQAADSDGLPIPADLLWNGARQVRAVQDYASSPVFLRHAGRDFHICDMTTESIGRAMAALRTAGHPRGFFKTRDKGETTVFDVPAEGDDKVMRAIPLNDPYAFVMREGDQACVYVQQAIRPTREYRIFVVGDRIVTGAGCIVSHTPCDNEGDAFDERMEPIRYTGEIVRDRRTVARYRAFAHAYAMAWAAEHGHDMGYALDLCIDADTGRVQIVEMNPLANVGLYAIRPDLLVDAMTSHPAFRAAA